MKLTEMFGAGMLTGLEIEKRVKAGDIEIDPFDKTRINPNSYNLRLAKDLKIYALNSNKDMSTEALLYGRNVNFLDSHSVNETIDLEIPDEGIILVPNTLYIGKTIERTKTDKFIPMINGRSSGGRLGLSVHICAGFGDIGFDGTWTLEITVVHPLKVYPGDEIAQVCFFSPVGDYSYKYNGRYQGQIDATPSKFCMPKRKDSLGLKFIEDREHKDIATTLRMIYGAQEFINMGIDLRTADISFELYPGEMVDMDMYIYKMINLTEDGEYSRVDGTDLVNAIGKVYELNGGKQVYVRRK